MRTLGVIFTAEEARIYLAKRNDAYADFQKYPALLTSLKDKGIKTNFPAYPFGFATNENTWSTQQEEPRIVASPSKKYPGFDITLTRGGKIIPQTTTFFLTATFCITVVPFRQSLRRK